MFFCGVTSCRPRDVSFQTFQEITQFLCFQHLCQVEYSFFIIFIIIEYSTKNPNTCQPIQNHMKFVRLHPSQEKNRNRGNTRLNSQIIGSTFWILSNKKCPLNRYHLNLFIKMCFLLFGSIPFQITNSHEQRIQTKTNSVQDFFYVYTSDNLLDLFLIVTSKL